MFWLGCLGAEPPKRPLRDGRLGAVFHRKPSIYACKPSIYASRSRGRTMLTARKDTPLQFDPSLPGLAADPYPVYHRLRAEDPVHWSPIIGMWVLTRYADAVAVVRDDSRFAKGGRQVVARKLASGPLLEVQSRWMLFLDPPDHERLRGLVTKAFTARRVEEMRPRIQSIVDELLDAVEDGEMGGRRE